MSGISHKVKRPESGFVALIDILGFRELVNSGQHIDKLDEYIQVIKQVYSSMPKGHEVKYLAFSDSLILTKLGSSDSDLLSLITFSSRLMSDLLQIDIAIRGAISYGSFTRVLRGGQTFIAGRAIIDAYYFEQQQNWIGIMLAPSVLKKVADIASKCKIGNRAIPEELQRDLQNPWISVIAPWGGIPFKPENHFESSDFQGFALLPSPPIADPIRVLNNMTLFIDKLQELKAIAPNPSAQRKYDETMKFMRSPLRNCEDLAMYFQMVSAGASQGDSSQVTGASVPK